MEIKAPSQGLRLTPLCKAPLKEKRREEKRREEKRREEKRREREEEKRREERERLSSSWSSQVYPHKLVFLIDTLQVLVKEKILAV
ncbi:hypothetical protein DUI87_26074 [Hirundo rustica rustica]|uniref:Uncharacterized protein n=1 Tax=Hirundo rustica rustica TaxID=333673 RepID=A0A3M0JEQ5_HIRRU|nr:hypothetical protein DUI87_26074 [Hirundo rustica rustica]